MNDRFKFRVWHKPLKTMHYNDFIVTATGYMAKIYQQDDYMMKFNQEDLEFDKQCIPMQCTGLKDKNGKLIYEGDIVNQIYEDETIYKCEVVYNNCSFQLKHIEDKNKNYINTPMYCYAINYLGHYTEKKLEVIGNAYENKELLEDTECQR